MQIVSVDEEEDEIEALNLGIIAAYYYIQYTTIELLASSLTAKTKLKGLLEIVSSASEFDELPMRPGQPPPSPPVTRSVCVHVMLPDMPGAISCSSLLFVHGMRLHTHLNVCQSGYRKEGCCAKDTCEDCGDVVQARMIRCGSCCCMRRCPLTRPSGRTRTPRSTRCCRRTSPAPASPPATWPLTRGRSSSRPRASCRCAPLR